MHTVRPGPAQASLLASQFAGVALIEVMVALVVLAIGILGLASLQFASLKFNRSSYERSQATLLVYEIADKMRSNRTEAYKGSYAFARDKQPSKTAAKDCATASCSSNEMAGYELSTWYSRVTTALPGSTAEVTCTSPCTTTSQQRVTVFWPEGTVSNVDLSNCRDPTPLAGNSCVTTVLFP